MKEVIFYMKDWKIYTRVWIQGSPDHYDHIIKHLTLKEQGYIGKYENNEYDNFGRPFIVRFLDTLDVIRDKKQLEELGL